MNITYLIGNGFDLGLGLKTSFRDFFPLYCEQMKSEGKDGLKEEIEKDVKEWADFEMALGRYTSNFTVKTQEKFFKVITDFQERFYQYLESEEQRVYYDSTVIDYQFREALFRLFDTDVLNKAVAIQINEIFRKHESEKRIFNFINFNYTYSFDKCLKEFPPKGTESNKNNLNFNWEIGTSAHVHGTRTDNPILGVDNVNQIANKELAGNRNFVNRFIKQNIDNGIGMLFSTEAQGLIGRSQIICVYGMSLGATDASWWKELAKWLHNSLSRYLIIFDYDPDFNEYIPSQTYQKRENVKDRFLKYSGLNESVKESLKEKIFVAVNQNVFGMPLA